MVVDTEPIRLFVSLAFLCLSLKIPPLPHPTKKKNVDFNLLLFNLLDACFERFVSLGAALDLEF